VHRRRLGSIEEGARGDTIRLAAVGSRERRRDEDADPMRREAGHFGDGATGLPHVEGRSIFDQGMQIVGACGDEWRVRPETNRSAGATVEASSIIPALIVGNDPSGVPPPL
jgi:hypothetical protein